MFPILGVQRTPAHFCAGHSTEDFKPAIGVHDAQVLGLDAQTTPEVGQIKDANQPTLSRHRLTSRLRVDDQNARPRRHVTVIKLCAQFRHAVFIDDVLDVTADSATLGKTAGKDAANDKPTFVSLMGLERSRQYADELMKTALTALQRSGLQHTQALHDLAWQVVGRRH